MAKMAFPRISKQTRDMVLLGLSMFLAGFYLRLETKQLQPYQPPEVIERKAMKDKKKPVKRRIKTAATESTSNHTRHPNSLLHIIKTRFFLYQPDSPEVLQARLQLFQTFVLPAMVHQTSQNFFWIVSYEDDLKKEYIDQLRLWMKPYPHYYLTDVTLDNRYQGGRDVYDKIAQSARVLTGDVALLRQHTVEYDTVPVLETRVDADEALHRDFVRALQVDAARTLASPTIDWKYWCIHKALQWQWLLPGWENGLTFEPTTSNVVTTSHKSVASPQKQRRRLAAGSNSSMGVFMDSDWDPEVCAIPALTVGFRLGGQTDDFVRYRAVQIREALQKDEPVCGKKKQGLDCLTVWGDEELEYPVLHLDTPATAELEKTRGSTVNAPSLVDEVKATEYFEWKDKDIKSLVRALKQIPPYYVDPPKVDRAKDWKVMVAISKLDASAIPMPDPDTQPGYYSKTNPGVLHIIKTRFMQQQPKLKALGKARLELFKAVTLPSMVYQSSQNFFWLVYTDPKLDPTLMQELVEILEPYPHFYLVTSLQDRKGLGGKDIKNDLMPEDFKVGDTKKLYSNLENVHYLNVLESRLDADDALNINWIEEVQRRAKLVFAGGDDEGRDWMYWCINQAMEWNWVGPGDRKPLQKFGALIFPPSYDEKHICHTPGLTLGFKRGTFTRTLVKASHNKLYEVLEKEEEFCGPEHKGTDCIEFITNFTFAAIRTRSPASASMAGVNTNGGRPYRLAAEEGEERWNAAVESFVLLPNNTKAVSKHFVANILPILKENLAGQCTQGHSCRDVAKELLNWMIKLYSPGAKKA